MKRVGNNQLSMHVSCIIPEDVRYVEADSLITDIRLEETVKHVYADTEVYITRKSERQFLTIEITAAGDHRSIEITTEDVPIESFKQGIKVINYIS